MTKKKKPYVPLHRRPILHYEYRNEESLCLELEFNTRMPFLRNRESDVQKVLSSKRCYVESMLSYFECLTLGKKRESSVYFLRKQFSVLGKKTWESEMVWHSSLFLGLLLQEVLRLYYFLLYSHIGIFGRHGALYFNI